MTEKISVENSLRDFIQGLNGLADNANFFYENETNGTVPDAISNLNTDSSAYKTAEISWTAPDSRPPVIDEVIQINRGFGWETYTTDVPDPIDDLQVTQVANKEVLVEFTLPDYNNEPITEYTYQYRVDGSSEWITVE